MEEIKKKILDEFEKKLKDVIYIDNGCDFEIGKYIQNEILELKAFISKAIDIVIAGERERIMEAIKGVDSPFPDEVRDFVDNYDDYISGILDTKLKMLDLLK